MVLGALAVRARCDDEDEDECIVKASFGVAGVAAVLIEKIIDAEIAVMNGTQGGYGDAALGRMTWRELKYTIERVVDFQKRDMERAEAQAKHLNRGR